MSPSSASVQSEREPTPGTMPAWKTELNAKLEAHRRRRSPAEALPEAAPRVRDTVRDTVKGQETEAGRAMAARVAARVAERYAHAPSYSEVLAARAAAASAAAGAAAAAIQQAHVAAQDLLTSLAAPQWEHEEPDSRGGEGGLVDLVDERADARGSTDWRLAERDSWQGRSATVEHPEPLPARAAAPPRPGAGSSVGILAAASIVDAFAEAEVPAAMSLPAKLIEFPRELVAAQRARPRLAEGPLVEEDEAGLLPLRIFEVHQHAGEQGSTEAETAAGERGAQIGAAEPVLTESNGHLREARGVEREEPLARGQQGGHHGGRAHDRDEDSRDLRNAREAAPAWQSIRLGEHPRYGEEELTLQHRGHIGGRAKEAQVQPAPALSLARMADRAMAALVDLGLVAGGFLLFVLTFAACTTHPPAGRMTAICCGIVFAALAVFYQWLFLSYGGGTPGMRYARIALCTFDDNNPTRAMLRSRVWAGVLVALPLGLGFLWALFDEDALGWHDRLTGTYQRSY